MTVLILSRDLDPTSDNMIEALAARDVRAVRINTAWFPTELRMTAHLDQGRWVGKLHTPAHVLDLAEIRSVWYRSPEAHRIPSNLSVPIRDHVFMEVKHGFGGVVGSVDRLWVDHPSKIADASYKPVQLARAHECGLTVPDTVITNCPDTVRRFAEEGRTVRKQMSTNTVLIGGSPQVAWTHGVTSDDLADLRGVEISANLLQRQLVNHFDARVIVIGDQMWAFQIHSSSSAIDYRCDYDATQISLIELPDDITHGVRGLMRSFGLLYGAVDFIVTPDGEWTFLEINPGNGQYLGLERTTGAQMTAALADLLAAGCSTAPATPESGPTTSER